MTYLDFLNKHFPVRRSAEEKKEFRSYMLSEAEEMGLHSSVETTLDGKNDNVIIGDPKSAKIVLTAHYDTPAPSLFPNIMIPRNIPLFFAYQMLPVIVLLAIALSVSYLVGIVWLGNERAYMLTFLALYYGLFILMFRGFSNPKNYNDNSSGVATLMELMKSTKGEDVAFIFFDNEEKGKKGSKAYFNDHKADMEKKLLINFDCVGNGKTIVFIAKEEAEKTDEYKALMNSFAQNGEYTTEFYPMRGSESNSDYKNFPMGIGCMACKKTKGGMLYTPAIHTRKDTTVKNENIEYITDGIVQFLGEIKK